jgi:hypothetical protein
VPEVELHHVIVVIGVIAGLALQGGGILVAVTMFLSRMEKRLSDKIATERREIDEAHSEAVSIIHRQHSTSLETIRREFGEVVSALRQKVHEIETWSRDHFVRRDSFEHVIGEIKDMIAGQGEKIDKRLERIDEKLDRR